MKNKILGILLLIIGVLGIGTSLYIQRQIEEGKAMIGEAQEKVDQGKSLFSLVPAGKEVGGQLSRPFDEQISRGAEEIAKYERIAFWLMVGGIVVAVIGVATLLTCKRR